MSLVASTSPAASATSALLRQTPDEEHRVRTGADGAFVEVWRRIATIAVPPAALASLADACAAARAQLPLPLDPWGDEDTLPFAAAWAGPR